MIDTGIAQILSAAITVVVPIAALAMRQQLKEIHLLVNSQLSDAVGALRAALIEVATLKAEIETLRARAPVTSCPTATELARSRR